MRQYADMRPIGQARRDQPNNRDCQECGWREVGLRPAPEATGDKRQQRNACMAPVPIDMRMGTERLLAQVVQVFGAARAHHGYLFANARGNRMKLLLHDGIGMWCAARRLNQGGFEWSRGGADMATSNTLTQQQFDALVLGLIHLSGDSLHNATMLNVHELSPKDFVGLSPAAAAELAARVLAHFGAQNRQIESQALAIQFKDAKIDSIMFELRRLKF